MSNKIFFTPGPSQLYFTVEQHLKQAIKEDIPSISHRSKDFIRLYQSCVETLTELLDLPTGYHIFFTGSATEIWERISQNLIGTKSFHFVNGSFSQKFQQIASEYGKDARFVDPGFGKSFINPSIDEDAELISITYNETSAGFQFEKDHLAQIRAEHQDQLIALDVVSIAPSVPIAFDQVDTAYFSVQKSFGLPAGLGIWIANDRCIEKSKKLQKEGHVIGSYHSLPSLYQSGIKYQTPETPNVLGIYLLQKVAYDMLQKGKDMMHRDTVYKATVLNQLFEKTEWLSPSISSKENRSKTVCVADVKGGNGWLLDKLASKGLIVGKGYGNHKDTQIRIANFPTHSKEQIELLADSISSINQN